MVRLWRCFRQWLYDVRHPCTIIRFDEAPAKGVKITLTYSGDAEKLV